MLGERETASAPKVVGNKLSMITLGEITRMLRRTSHLRGKVYVVGGIVTEGQTLRDIDIVITNPQDISRIKDALGKYSSRAHFIPQKTEPPATLFVKVTGKDARSPDVFKPKKKQRVPKNEYAS